jgi:protein-L-isoaspartate(D-aspartate) O-methyltransferase
VPRERFIPEARMAMAYADAMVPLKPGREMNNPMALGRLLTEAAPQKGRTGARRRCRQRLCRGGAQRLVGPVTAVEEDAELAAFARRALAGYPVTLIEGPVGEGHAAGGPYDLILVDGAIEYVPDSLIAQLTDRGRLAAAMLDNGVSRLSLGRKAGEVFGTAAFTDAAAAVLPGFAKPKTFTF